MKKTTKFLCLTLAMLMLMSTGAWAASSDYKILPVHENFSSVTYSGNVYNTFNKNNSYNGATEDLSTVTALSSAEYVSVKPAIGLGGKGIEDIALHIRLNDKNTSDKTYGGSAVLSMRTFFGVEGEEEGSITEGTYSNVVHEFDFITLGEGGNLVNAYGKNSGGNSVTKAVIEDNKIASHFLDENDEAVDFTFEQGKWYHVALVYLSSDKEIEIYVNGEKEGYFTTDKTYLSSQESSFIEVRPDAPVIEADATNEEIAAELAKYQFAIDNIEIYSGEYDSANDFASVVSNVSNIVVGENKITVPYGTTVSELKNSLSEQSGGTVRVYESLAATSEVVSYSSSTTATSKELASTAVLEADNLVVAENASRTTYGNAYAYYDVEVEDGISAKQDGTALTNSFSDLTKDIVVYYAEKPDATVNRILLAGVYDADGDLVAVKMSSDSSTSFTAEKQGTLSVTIPKESLTGLTNTAKVKAFVWVDTDDIQPADVTSQSVSLTYSAAN